MRTSNVRRRAPICRQATRNANRKATRESSPKTGREVAAGAEKTASDSAMASSTRQPGLRALTMFDVLPKEHVTFLVTEGGAEPHLRRSEYAVIDTTDRDLQHGELY